MNKNNSFAFSSVLRILLGIVLLNEFFLLWQQDFFMTSGFVSALQLISTHGAFAVQRAILQFFIGGASFFSWLAAIVLLLTSVCLIAGWVTRYAQIALVGIFSVYYLSHIGVSGTWMYEFAMPLGLAILSLCYCQPTKRIAADMRSLSWVKLFVVSVIVMCGLLVVNLMSLNGFWVAVLTAMTSVVLLWLNFLCSKCSSAERAKPINEQALINKVVIFIGTMLVAQVHMNHLINWFTVPGYTNLINIYQQYSTIGPHISVVMNFIKTHANIVLSLQVTLESFLALCLIVLVFRPIAFLLSALLFLGLAIIEFGVPATFPIKYPVEHTWVWELLLAAVTMLTICYYEYKRMRDTDNLIGKLLGPAMFTNVTVNVRCLWSVLIGAMTFLIVLLSHNVAKQSLMFSLQSGLTVFFYMLLFHLLDALKGHSLIKAQA